MKTLNLLLTLIFFMSRPAQAKDLSILVTSIDQFGHCIAFNQEEQPIKELDLTVKNCPEIAFSYPEKRSKVTYFPFVRKQSHMYLIAPNGVSLCDLSDAHDLVCNRLKVELKIVD